MEFSICFVIFFFESFPKSIGLSLILDIIIGGNTDNVTLFLECNLKLASTSEFHVECNTLHYNETAKHCTMGNQGIIGDIGYLYMENVGFGLIFDGK